MCVCVCTVLDVCVSVSIFNALTCLFRRTHHAYFFFVISFFIFHVSYVFLVFFFTISFNQPIKHVIAPYPCIWWHTTSAYILWIYNDWISLNKLKIIVWHHVSDFLCWLKSKWNWKGKRKWKILNTHTTGND